MISYGTYFNPIVGAYLYPRGEDFEKEKYFERIIVNSDILNSNGVPEILAWIYKIHIGLPIVTFVRK